MNPNPKNAVKPIDDASNTTEEPIRDVTDQHAEAVAGGIGEVEIGSGEPPMPKRNEP